MIKLPSCVIVGFLRGVCVCVCVCSRGGGNWGTFKYSWGKLENLRALGKIRGISTPPLRILLLDVPCH